MIFILSTMQRAFLVSLAIHSLPVGMVFLLPGVFSAAQEDKKPWPVYSVLLEKRHNVTKVTATKKTAPKQASARTTGTADFDLKGEHRALKADYEMALSSLIEKQRYYPRTARQRGEEGRPVVKLVLDTQGRLVQVYLESSSGIELLDEAALDIVNRAQPFPAPPAAYVQVLQSRGDNRMIFRAPISFALSRTR